MSTLMPKGGFPEDGIGLRGKRVQGRVSLMAASPAAELFPIRSSKNLDRFFDLEL
jgi:hypothetical protein